MQQPMRLVTFGILSIFLLIGLYVIAGKGISTSSGYTAHVTLKVKEAENQDWSALQKQLATYQDLDVEFLCKESGVMVLRITGTEFSETADVQILVKNRLSPVLESQAFQFLDIQLSSLPTEGNC